MHLHSRKYLMFDRPWWIFKYLVNFLQNTLCKAAVKIKSSLGKPAKNIPGLLGKTNTRLDYQSGKAESQRQRFTVRRLVYGKVPICLQHCIITYSCGTVERRRVWIYWLYFINSVLFCSCCADSWIKLFNQITWSCCVSVFSGTLRLPGYKYTAIKLNPAPGPSNRLIKGLIIERHLICFHSLSLWMPHFIMIHCRFTYIVTLQVQTSHVNVQYVDLIHMMCPLQPTFWIFMMCLLLTSTQTAAAVSQKKAKVNQ